MLAGKSVVLKVSGDGLTLTSAITTEDDTVYQVDDADQVVLNPDDLVVLDDGVPTTEDHVVNYLTGTITFETADAGRLITLQGEYLPMSTVAQASAGSISEEVELLDASYFGVEYVKRSQGLKSASGSLTQIDITDTVFLDALRGDVPLILEMAGTSDKLPRRYKILTEEVEHTSDVTELQEKAIAWMSTDEWIRLGG